MRSVISQNAGCTDKLRYKWKINSLNWSQRV